LAEALGKIEGWKARRFDIVHRKAAKTPPYVRSSATLCPLARPKKAIRIEPR
jgi:hypothetical protein